MIEKCLLSARFSRSKSSAQMLKKGFYRKSYSSGLWGRIDLILGKERLFETLGSYDGFPDAWKEVERAS